MSRRIRGTGRGRRTRRSLARGGTGPAAALNALVSGWPGVRITAMFGRWGYFVGSTLFACFPLRAKDHDLWIRLSREDQARALGEPGVIPHRRLAGRGWVELSVAEARDVARAGRWLRRAWKTARERAEREGPEEA